MTGHVRVQSKFVCILNVAALIQRPVLPYLYALGSVTLDTSWPIRTNNPHLGCPRTNPSMILPYTDVLNILRMFVSGATYINLLFSRTTLGIHQGPTPVNNMHPCKQRTCCCDLASSITHQESVETPLRHMWDNQPSVGKPVFWHLIRICCAFVNLFWIWKFTALIQRQRGRIREVGTTWRITY